ncbi:hypothetical protein BDZ91DRAFT_533639 [Kalaharituber pfeilii]|nr:hypothetical protein BDZ91DRAFT_533639 [Kalaharituber pfeilii]
MGPQNTQNIKSSGVLYCFFVFFLSYISFFGGFPLQTFCVFLTFAHQLLRIPRAQCSRPYTHSLTSS